MELPDAKQDVALLNTKAFVFTDINLIEREVHIQGVVSKLREASAEAVIKYRNAATKGVRMEDGKVTGMDGIADSELVLVAACLFRPEANTYRKMTVEDVSKWPYKIVRPLFDWVKEVSEIDPPETKESLWKQFHAIQRKIRALEQGDPAKNGPSSSRITYAPLEE